MGWYFADETANGKQCSICKKPIVGENVSQEEFVKENFKEKRDKVYFTDNGVDHAFCVWKQVEA